MDLLVLMVQPVWMELSDRPVLKAHLELMVIQEHQVLMARQDFPV